MPACPRYEDVLPPRTQKDVIESKFKNEWEASLLSRLTWSWLNGQIFAGYKKPLEPEDLGVIAGNDDAEYCMEVFEKHWNDNSKPAADGTIPKRDWRKLLRSLTLPRIKPMVIAGISKLIGDSLGFVAPICLAALLDWMAADAAFRQDPLNNPQPSPEYVAYLYGLAIFGANSLESILLQQHHHLVIRSGIQARSTIIQAVFEKSMRLPQSVLDDPASGASQAVTLQSNDAEKIHFAYYFVHYAWAAPLQMAISLYLLYLQLGVSAFVGFVVMVMLVPIQVKLGDYLKLLSRRTLELTDQRLGFVKELLHGMKLIKLNTFESGFISKITAVRGKELAIKWRMAIVSGLNQASLEGGPVLVALISFTVYAQLSGEPLTASKAYTSLNLFQILRLPLMVLPMLTRTVAAAVASLERVSKFLDVEDYSDYREVREDPGSKRSVEFSDATLGWSASPGFRLNNLNLHIPRGKLTVVLGRVGSGKSALLAGVLGEMHLESGHVSVHQEAAHRGCIAYCSQTPFITNATLKENITMGVLPVDEGRYAEAVWAAALEDDIKILPGGHQQEIGDRGVTLSGGQKARISVARALYRQNVEMYVLDSVLSAVDAMVAQQILSRCVFGLLQRKTVVLATHRDRLAMYADCVVRIETLPGSEGMTATATATANQRPTEPARESRGQSVREPGAINENSVVVKDVEELETSTNNKDNVNEADELETSTNNKDNVKEADVPETSATNEGKLVQEEKREVGSVKSKYFVKYLSLFGYLSAVVIVFLVAGRNTAMVATDWWLGEWSTEQGNQTTEYYLQIYAGLAGAHLIVLVCYSLSFALWALRAARRLHAETLHSVIRAPMSFFDETPTGRVLNRFSNDTANIDERLPEVASSFILICTQVVVVLGVQIAALPVMAIAVVILVVIYYFILLLYRANYREINRIVNVTRSPVYSQLAESLAGVGTLRAFRDTERLAHVSASRTNSNAHMFWRLNLVNRWLGFRLDLLGAVIVLAAVMVSVGLRFTVGVGVIGLVLSYSLGITRNLNWVVRQATEAESAMNAIERMVEYTNIPGEAPEVVPGNRPPSNWPSAGALEFSDVCLRYRPNLPLALDRVNLSIAAGSKVGCCGRTGSGKSTLLSALFRLVELESGKMMLDGLDIGTIGLKDLRTKIALVPQDPLLFQGSLRYNLDMQEEYSDAEIWEALELAQIKDAVVGGQSANEAHLSSAEVEGGLNTVVREGGSNWSNGERQLLCCARILLKRRTARVIALDEATSSIDEATDQILSDTLAQHFKHATVITVAHRLNTIVSRCDTIVVMEAGKVAEVGTPEELRSKADGHFRMLEEEFNRSH